MGVIKFNGKSSSDFGCIIEAYPNHTRGSRRGELIVVPGRNGNVVLEDGSYTTYMQAYSVVFEKGDNHQSYQRAAEVAEWLLGSRGFCRLEDSFEPGYYRLARYAGPLNIKQIMDECGRATLEFECQPERYLKIGDVLIRIHDYGYGTDIFVNDLPENVSSVTVKSTLATTKMWMQNSQDYTDRIEATLQNQDGLYVGSLDPTSIYRVVHIASGISGQRITLLFTYSDGTETEILSTGDSVITLFNPTEFEALPLLKFVDTSEEPSIFRPTTIEVENTYIAANGAITNVTWESGISKHHKTIEPYSVVNYKYAYPSGCRYAFYDENDVAVFVSPLAKYNGEQVIIPDGVKKIAVGTQDGYPSLMLELKAERPDPGTAAATINGTTINLDFSAYDTIHLDCDLHDAYYADGSSANSAVSFSSNLLDYPTFPGLVPGENTITATDGHDLRFEISPRWWLL